MKKKLTFGSVVVILLLLALYFILPAPEPEVMPEVSVDQIPAYSGEPFVVLANNVPAFQEKDYVTESYEFYEDLDAMNRCTYTMACIGPDLMPTEDRGDIGMIRPTGWVTAKYDFVDGKYLYNRCHLIGFQLAGENANELNLITGTRTMNTQGMLPFENMVADYIDETDNHVLYRVTPVYNGTDLVAQGVQMEACPLKMMVRAFASMCFVIMWNRVWRSITRPVKTGLLRRLPDGEALAAV
jgi:DNA-entry nuclease